jgi:uncharacterized protein
MIVELQELVRERVRVSPDQIADFCQRWQIIELALFGSILRSDFREDSDVDILVAFSPDSNWSLLDWVDMKEQLEKIFDRAVDLVDKEGLTNPYRRYEILKNYQVVYASK